ncbi:DUF6884 domain-containing protein [Geodermatophilus marinus]|uniref:DUF6884 domain-containing protein n=1 Tax=Geodermatophilus sp. LHW52908 TaxID=2303986 RepID=UPI0011C12344|nr:DUF6884 domain-containing protein [Geodermatophilus sp. LHW52908]
MDFLLNGIRYALDTETVRTAVRGRTPDEGREHWVDVDGVRWPPKQVFALATGLDRGEFTSHTALRQLRRLGFVTSDWGAAGRAATGAVQPPSRTASLSSARVVLVGCSSSKAPTARPAAELFTGAAFTKARDLAISTGAPWYVVSAKFGLLDPAEVVAPYDVYPPDQPASYRAAWGAWVVAQLASRHELCGTEVEVHAGRAYCDPLRAPLAAAGATLVEPLAGLTQGERLAWYGRRPPSHELRLTPGSCLVPDVSPLLDPANAAIPSAFLAAGRAAADRPGLYSWWVDAAGADELTAGLGHLVEPGLVYAGRAGGIRPNGSASANTLWGRVAEMHLGGNRSFSTFRLTLAACLSASAGRAVGETEVSDWIHAHLSVAVLPLAPEDVSPGETELLGSADPPLNLSGVPRTPLRQALTRLRSALTRSARAGTA